MLNVVAIVQFLESRIWFPLNPALIRMPLRKKSTMNEYEKIDNMLFQLEYELLCLSLSINLLSSFYSVVLLCLWEGKSGEGGTVLNIVGCPVLNLVRTNQSLSALSLSFHTEHEYSLCDSSVWRHRDPYCLWKVHWHWICLSFLSIPLPPACYECNASMRITSL